MRKAKTFTKTDLEERRKRGPHAFSKPRRHEQPELVPEAVNGVTVCKTCGYRPQTQTVVCSMCKNCQYCGLYNADEDFTRCYYCGATLPEHKRIATMEVPTINIKRSRGGL